MSFSFSVPNRLGPKYLSFYIDDIIRQEINE